MGMNYTGRNMEADHSQYFTRAELMCKCGCGQCPMGSKFLARLDALRWRYNQPIVLFSAYRCPDYNDEVSSTGRTGPHTTGKAVDIKCAGVDAHRILTLAAKLSFSGLGVSQKGYHKSRFIHIDDIDTDGKRPWVWSY